jgi:acetoin utilization deacetylase AcuC-like enzyme
MSPPVYFSHPACLEHEAGAGHPELPERITVEATSFAEMGRQLRALGERTGAPAGAVLEGGYALDALASSVCATMPDFLTSRAASYVGHHWTL